MNKLIIARISTILYLYQRNNIAWSLPNNIHQLKNKLLITKQIK